MQQHLQVILEYVDSEAIDLYTKLYIDQISSAVGVKWVKIQHGFTIFLSEASRHRSE